MEVKDLLRMKRIEKDMTMKELAEKVGVSEGTISRWESGDIANMKRDKIVALAEALGISPLAIMGIDMSDIPETEFQMIAKQAFVEYKALQALPAAERELLTAFRAADPVTKGIVAKILGIGGLE